jgi:hypothetical protein
MKLFKFDEDNKMYTIDVPNSTHFLLAIDYVRCGLSVQQTVVAIRHTKDRLKVQKLGNINDHNVGQYVCALVTTNLNKITEVFFESIFYEYITNIFDILSSWFSP